MALSPREEHEAAVIEDGLRARDAAWARRVDGLVADLDRGHRAPRWPIAACLVAGVVLLLLAVPQSVSLELALASGLPAATIRATLLACGAGAALISLVLLGRAGLERLRHRRAAAGDGGKSVATLR
jgi:hypothetical protein